MAARKSSRKRLSSHGEQRPPTARRRTSHSRRGSAGKPLAPCVRKRADRASAVRGALKRSEIIRLLAEALALLRTIGMAMREFEDHPTFGNVCVAFNHAVEVLGRAHSEVGRLVERRAS